MIVLRLAWRNLWRHPIRTVLTASGVALGLGFLLVMLGLGDGSHLQMIDAAVRMGGGHVLLQAPDYQRRRGIEMLVPEARRRGAEAWARAEPGVRAVLPRAFVSALVSSADGATGVTLTGVDPAAEAPVSRFPSRITSGRFLRSGDREAAVIGSGVARLLRAQVGSRVVAMAQGAAGGEVRSTLLRVVGILHTGLDEVDDALALTALGPLQDFLSLHGGVHQVALVLDDQARSASVARAARAAFPDLETLTWAEADPQLEAAIKIDDGGHYLFNSIFFVIIGFMVLNTLLMSVLERRRELALLGALGLSPRRRFAMVLVEAVYLAALASAAGLVLAGAAHAYFSTHGLPLAWFTEQSLETGGVMLEPVMYSSLTAARVLGAVGVVGALTLGLALVAARHAAKPVDVGLLK
jgi:ABC-type lipoprotein release transport system permease subunit